MRRAYFTRTDPMGCAACKGTSAVTTIDFVALLTWLIAAGVIGAIIYLTAIERTRDFAILRATGSANRTRSISDIPPSSLIG